MGVVPDLPISSSIAVVAWQFRARRNSTAALTTVPHVPRVPVVFDLWLHGSSTAPANCGYQSCSRLCNDPMKMPSQCLVFKPQLRRF